MNEKRKVGLVWKDEQAIAGEEWVVQFPKGLMRFNTKRLAENAAKTLKEVGA